MSEYARFLESKAIVVHPLGREVSPGEIHPSLFDFQRDMVRWSVRKGRAALFEYTGLGKAQPIDEPVLTPDGWRPIGSLATGDMVMAVDGHPTRVIGVYRQGVRPIVRVRFNDGASVRCDRQHLWTIATDSTISKGQPWRIWTADQILERGLTDASGRYRWRIPVVAPIEYATAALPIDPYILGALLGDGTFRRASIEMCSADPAIPAEIATRLPDGMRLATATPNGRTQGYRVVVAGRTNWHRTNPYLDALKGWGLHGKLAHEKHIPAEYLTASIPQRLDLLRGLMDTDGYVSGDGTVQFGTSSPSLADDVLALVRSLGGIARRSLKMPTYPHHGERRTGRPHHTLTIALPAGVVPFLLDRKARRCANRFYIPQRKMVAIEPIGDAECVCIAIEHPSRLYVTADYVVTHNTRQQIEWARLIGERTLMLAPLAVTQQTIREGRAIGVEIRYARAQEDAAPDGLTITNYEMLHAFDPDAFGAVVLDESSILKNFEGRVRTRLIQAFRNTPYRLCATATPAPNDIAELANHAEFLGVMKREEMLAAFFVHDDQGWRLKGHAREPFYRWLASWGMSLTRPSDLGYPDDGYALPPLEITAVLVPTAFVRPGQLFATDLKGIGDRASVRKETLSERVKAAAELILSEPDEPWIAWVGLNDEGRELAKLIPGAVLVEGQDSIEQKTEAIERFVSGETRVMISKTSIFGFGLNLQRCARMVFVGLSDSYEQYFQAIRRCWRYGQVRPVHAYIVLTEPEEVIYANVCRKQREAEATAAELVKHVAAFERAEIASVSRRDDRPHDQPIQLPSWLQETA